MTDPVCEIVGNWPPNVPFDALRAIEAWTGGELSPSDVTALAIVELVDKDEAGEEIDLDKFLSRFPSCRDELIHRIGNITGSVLGNLPKINEVYFGQIVIRYLSLSSHSKVFLTVDAQIRSRVAVLKVTNGRAREPDFIARLNHHNIVTLYSLASAADENTTAFTVEYAGDSFAAENEPRNVLLQRLQAVAGAVEHMHLRGVIHNDLTFRNVMSSNECTKVIDFDASVSTGDPGADRPLGTLSYLSRRSLQELLLNQRFISSCDDSIDCYAFVVLCYRVLAGEVPWGENISPSPESIRELLAKRDSLKESELNAKQLTRRERTFFWKYLRESSRIPKPTVFLREFVRVRTTALREVAIAFGAVLSLVGVLVWGVVMPFQSVIDLNAETGVVDQTTGIRPELRTLFDNDDITALLIACHRERDTLTPMEKAIKAYCIGLCQGDRSMQISLGRSVVRSGYADASVYSNLAFALFLAGNLTEAYASVDAAIALDPKCPQAMFHKAVALASDRKASIEQALEAVLRILELLPREQAVQKLSIDVLAKLESHRDLSEKALYLGERIYSLLNDAEHEPSFETLSFYAKPYQSGVISRGDNIGVSAPSATLDARARLPTQSKSAR